MALQVNWNWRAPQIQQSNAAQNEANNLMQGAQNLANSLSRGRDRDLKREEDEQMQQRWLSEQNLAKERFAHQVEQDKLANAMKNREFGETSRMNTAKIQDMQDAAAIKQRQQDFNEKAYNLLYGNTPQSQEIAALQQSLALGSQEMQELQALMNDPVIKQYLQQQEAQNNASAILYGLNPQFSNLR